MKFKSIINITATALILASSGLVFAEADNILCPSVESVKQGWQSLDTVRKVSEESANVYEYSVWSSYREVEENDVSWALVTSVTAPDFNSAYTQAQNNVQVAAHPKEEFATDMGSFYLCLYVDGANNSTVAAVTDKADDSDNIRKAFMKLTNKK